MFRMSLLSCAVLAVVAQGSFAQDKKAEATIPQITPFPNPSAPSSAIPGYEPLALEPTQPSETPPAASVVYREKWAPAMRVFLNEAPGVQAVVENKMVQSEVAAPQFEPIQGVPIQKNSKSFRALRTEPEKVLRPVRSVTAGATVIDCDDVNVQVSTSKEGPKAFEFEIKGKLKLQNGSTLIEAKSAKLVDGKLTLTEVTLNTESMKMTCAELVLDLKVNALRVGEVTEPTLTPTPLTPIPSPGSAPFSPGFPAASSNNPFSSVIPANPSTSKGRTKGSFISQ